MKISLTHLTLVNKMVNLKQILPTRIYEVLDKAGIATSVQIIVLSVWDIKKLTNLRSEDILLIKNLITDVICPKSKSCKDILNQDIKQRLRTGCSEIDNVLRGGFRKGTITEVYGESGVGKTQIAIQAVVHNLPNYCVYLCTEGLFPINRFESVKKNVTDFDSEIDYGKNVFVEHLTESKDVIYCLRVRLVKLLTKYKISLIVLDSVAAPFRCEYSNYIQRADDLRELALLLINIAQANNLAVICINQVTASLEIPSELLPSLGLAWSNMVSTRLLVRKTTKYVSNLDMPDMALVRELVIIFGPDLANSVVEFTITPKGILGVL